MENERQIHKKQTNAQTTNNKRKQRERVHRSEASVLL